MSISEQEFQDLLQNHLLENDNLGLSEWIDEDEETRQTEEVIIRQVLTYAEDRVLTMNKGLVITLEDGSKFQLQIVKAN